MFGEPEKKIEERILVADRNPEHIHFIRTAFEGSTLKIAGTDSGKKCIEMVKEENPMVLVLDADLPDINGFEVCLSIKSRPHNPNISVVYTCESRDTDTLDKVFGTGGLDFILKPFHLLELKSKIALALFHSKVLYHQTEIETLKNTLVTSGDICHELNQPLQYMMGAAQLLQMDIDSENPAHGTIGQLIEKTSLMGEITKRLMTTIRSVKEQPL